MKSYYKYLVFIALIAILVLSPFKNTFAKITCGNGDVFTCASCGTSVFHHVPTGGSEFGAGPEYSVEFVGKCGKYFCRGSSCTSKFAQMIPSTETVKYFYESYYSLVPPTWNSITGDLKDGSKGGAVVSLSIILEGFGFAPAIAASDTGTIFIDDNYGNVALNAVKELQKALNLPVTGIFDGNTREVFSTFYYDISSILVYPVKNISKLAILYPNGTVSFFDGSKFTKPLLASSKVSAPTFMMQDSAGKNFLWQNEKWNATTTVFPTPKTIPSNSIKLPLSTFSTQLSDIVSRFTSSSARTSDPSLDILSKFGLSGAGIFEQFFGTTRDNTFNTVDITTSTDFSQKLDLAISKLPDNVSRLIIQSPSTNQISTFNSTDSRFSTPQNIISPSGDPTRSVSECVADWAPLVGLTAAIDACLGPAD